MTLEQRLARLERRNRWLTTALALVLLALGGVVLVAAKQDKPKVMEEVRAKKFVLVDEKGKELGGMSRKGDMTMLTLKGKKGEASVNLAARDGAATGFELRVGTKATIAAECVAGKSELSVSGDRLLGGVSIGDMEDYTGLRTGRLDEGIIEVGAFRGQTMYVQSGLSGKTEKSFHPSENPKPSVVVRDKERKPLFKAPK